MKVVNFRNGAAKLLLVVCFVMCAGSVFAQHRYFCELKSVENNASSSMYVIFDFGTRSSYNLLGVDNDKTVVDEKGKEINFHGIVDAADYMADRGWSFVQAYSTVDGDSQVARWIFTKQAASFEEAKAGIMTKYDYKQMKKK